VQPDEARNFRDAVEADQNLKLDSRLKLKFRKRDNENEFEAIYMQQHLTLPLLPQA
jgi:hypothetical protein